MDISKESLLSLAHEALLDDPLAIGQLNDLFIDNDLKKINVPNYRCRQNSYDSLVIDVKLQELLYQEDYEKEFQYWLSAVLTIIENGVITRNNTGNDFEFYINYGIEWKDVYKIHLSILLEREPDPTISVYVVNIVKFDAITSIILNLMKYLPHPVSVNYLYRILYNNILYGKQDRNTIYQNLRIALHRLITYTKDIVEDESNTKNLIDDNNKFMLNPEKVS